MSLFEIKRVFQEKRKDKINKDDGIFNMRKTIEQYGRE